MMAYPTLLKGPLVICLNISVKYFYGLETAVLGRPASFYEINSCYILMNFNQERIGDPLSGPNVLATNVDQFDKVIELNSQPICIKICREDKCNLNRPKSQCKSVEYYQRRNRLHEKSDGQRNQKNDQNERNQRNKRDIFLEYSSHDPITDLLKAVSKTRLI